MKTLLLLLALTQLLLGCGDSEKKPTDYLFIGIDLSDSFPMVNELNSAHIMKLLRVSKDSLYHGAIIDVAGISHLRYNRGYRATIEATCEQDANDIDRIGKLTTLSSEIDSFLNILRTTRETQGSHVFHAVISALNGLSAYPSCDFKRVIFLSDLRENSPVFNSYKAQELAVLKNHPEKIIALLEKHYPLTHSLNGVEVIFAHQPVSESEDEAFHLMSSVLKSYLSSKGASVRITQSLQF